MNESGLQKLIMLEVTRLGHRIFRNQVGKYRLADGRFLSSGLCVGSADLIGLTKSGRFLAIEVKTFSGVITPAQQNFITEINRMGGIAFVARSVQDVVDKLSVSA